MAGMEKENDNSAHQNLVFSNAICYLLQEFFPTLSHSHETDLWEALLPQYSGWQFPNKLNICTVWYIVSLNDRIRKEIRTEATGEDL